MAWKGSGTEMAANEKKKKITHFKNISEHCIVGVPPGAPQDEALYLHGKPLFIPPGKIIHDESGTMFPTLMATATRYFVKCASELEMEKLGVPKEVRDLAAGGFRGINFILKELSGDALAAEKDRAVLTQTEYATMKSKADQCDELTRELAMARAMLAAANLDLNKMNAKAEELSRLDAMAAENQKLRERLEAAERDLAKSARGRSSKG